MSVGALHVHPAHFAAASAHQFHDRADVAVRHVDHQELIRLVIDAANLLDDDLGLAHGQLVTFAPHRLDQDGEMKQAAAGDDERVARHRSSRRGERRSIPARDRADRSGAWT